MTVIPPERAGMAPGVAGTVRFSGIVVGFAALGALLFSRVSSTVSAGLSTASPADRLSLIRDVTAGDLSGAIATAGPKMLLHELAVRSFSDGYQAILLAATAFAAFSARLSWLLVRSADTVPVPHRTSQTASPMPALE